MAECFLAAGSQLVVPIANLIVLDDQLDGPTVHAGEVVGVHAFDCCAAGNRLLLRILGVLQAGIEFAFTEQQDGHAGHGLGIERVEFDGLEEVLAGIFEFLILHLQAGVAATGVGCRMPGVDLDGQVVLGECLFPVELLRVMSSHRDVLVSR